MFCPTCGNKMPEGASFCPLCGGATEPAQVAFQNTGDFQPYQATPMATPGVGTQAMEAPPGVAAGVPSPKKGLSSRNKGLIAGLAAAFAVVVVVVAAISFASPANAVAIDENEFPDPVFRAYVEENIDSNRDGKLSQDEIDSVTTIDISHAAQGDARVSDLTGIGHFRGLHTLNASHCDIQQMPSDFNHLHELRVCDLSYCQINQTVNVTENYNLIVIYVGGNQEGTTIEADPTTNVITDPDTNMINDPSILEYRGGEDDELVDPGDVDPIIAPVGDGEVGNGEPNGGDDNGGDDNGGGTATTGGDDTTEGQDEPTDGDSNGTADGDGTSNDPDAGNGSDTSNDPDAANGSDSDNDSNAGDGSNSGNDLAITDGEEPAPTEGTTSSDPQSNPSNDSGATTTTPASDAGKPDDENNPTSDDDQGGDSADHEATLRKYVEESASSEIICWFYDDYDRDGTYEAFAITGDYDSSFGESEKAWTDGTIWFVTDDGAEQIGDNTDGNVLNGMYQDPVSGDALLSVEKNGHGSGTSSTVYTVQNGTWKKVGADLDPIGAVKVEGGRIMGYTQSFDSGYHEYFTYELEYDPDTAMLHATNQIDEG